MANIKFIQRGKSATFHLVYSTNGQVLCGGLGRVVRSELLTSPKGGAACKNCLRAAPHSFHMSGALRRGEGNGGDNG